MAIRGQAVAGGTGRDAITIVPWIDCTVSVEERRRLADIARRLVRDEPAFAAKPFGDRVESGLGAAGTRVLIGDQSEIRLASAPEQTMLGYRMALLAGEGDLLVLATERSSSYERYLARLTGGKQPSVLDARVAENADVTPVSVRCLERTVLFDRIVSRARDAGEITIVPHIATGHIWRLAHAVSERAGVCVSVCGPPPRVSRRVNDKLWFAQRVRDVLGRHAVPPTFEAYGPAALAGHVHRLSKRHARVVVKLPDSAGSLGNLTLDGPRLRRSSPAGIHDMLTAVFGALGWHRPFPLMVGVWEEAVLASPSVQMWVPLAGDSLPIVEGVFEQIVAGERGKFVGAVRARLPEPWPARLAEEAVRIAMVFQQIGYFGRCSFDAIISGNRYSQAATHWIECNGRWGGVSVPMTLLNRIAPEPKATQPVIVQRTLAGLARLPFDDVLRRLEPVLWAPGGSEGIVVLTPSGFEFGEGAHYMALSPTLDRAMELARCCDDLILGEG